jgi:hypothetical protein
VPFSLHFFVVFQLYTSAFAFEKEYSLLSAYNMVGNLSNTEFWIRLEGVLRGNITLSLQYLKYKFVSVINPPIAQIEKKIGVRVD